MLEMLAGTDMPLAGTEDDAAWPKPARYRCHYAMSRGVLQAKSTAPHRFSEATASSVQPHVWRWSSGANLGNQSRRCKPTPGCSP